MHSPVSIATVSTVLLALTTAASAQFGISTTLVSTTRTPRSIVMAPHPVGLHAIVSMSQQSEQIPVDVTIPTSPVVGTSVLHAQDQYCDAWWTDAFGGRLLTAHRGGGIQLWDAAWPTIVGPIPQLGYTATNYSHEGLETWSDGAGNTYALYSEQHTSSLGQGGLRVYRVNASSLAPIGQNLITGSAGRQLEVSANGGLVWQWSDRNNNQLDGVLRVYQTNNYTGNPTLVNSVPYAFTYGYADTDLERNHSSTTLVSAMGWDGLTAMNITTPTNPTINTMIGAQQTIFFDGVTFIPGTDFALTWGFFKIGTLEVDFMLFLDTSIPGFASPVGGPIFPGYRIDDLKIEWGHIYAVGRTRTTNLQSIVVVY